MPTSTTNYAHPFICIQIFDNTEFVTSEVVTERKDFNGMQVGFFAGGRDNQLLYMQNQESYLREYGNPNFRKFGQAAYNVDNALATGNCGMYVLNLRPDTATYANTIIMVRFKVGEVDGGTTDDQVKDESEGTIISQDETVVNNSKLIYSFYAKTIEGAKTLDELTTAAIELMSADPDENGFYNMPLMLFYAMGRGAYGNGIHISFANATTYSTEDSFYEVAKPQYHVYTLTVAEASNDGLVKRELCLGGLDESGFDKNLEFGPSTYLEDVVNDVETGSQRINSQVYAATIDTICELYNNTFNPVEKATPTNLDILTRMTLDGTINENLELVTSEPDNLNLFSLDGFTLNSGLDGWDGMSAEEIEVAKEDLLIKAYSGDIDPFIKSRFSSPCNFNLDANYPINVKRQMAALANRRLYDCMTYIDLGTVATTSGMISLLTSLKNIYGFNVIKEGHNYKYRDTLYTGKVCNMTITHWLAKSLPNHMADPERGLMIPMCRDTAVLRSGADYIPGSFKPVIDPDAHDIKNTIYRLRANCYETLSYNSFHRSTAITSCPSKSDRLLEMNEYILQLAVKTIYDCMASRIYKLGEAEDRNQFEEDTADILDLVIGKYVRSYSVSLEMTPADEKKSLLRIKLHLTFKTIIQNGDVQIYLDPRVTDDVVAVTTTAPSTDDEE